MKEILTSFLLVLSACTNAAPVSNEDDGESLSSSLWERQTYRPPHFSLPIYKGTILSNSSIAIMDGPIILENTQGGMYFVITSDNYEDYAIHPINITSTNEQEIQLELTSSEPIVHDFDVIILEALDEDLVPVSRTTVLLFNSNNDMDMYKMKFKIDDSEYIVLNYFYFKWFLALLTVTGLLILIIELYEVVKNIRVARENARMRQYGKYQELLHI